MKRILRSILGLSSNKQDRAIVSALVESISPVFDNLLKELTGSGMTTRDEETIDYETGAQYDLWRKTQSMPAQVAQYKEAGINPMMLANGSAVGAVSSAGSAGSGSDPSALFGLVSSLLDFSLKKKMTDADVQVRQATAEGLSIDNAWKERMNKANYLRTMADASFITQNTQKVFQDTRFAEIYADFAPQLFSLQLEQGDADIKSKLQGIVESMSRVQVNEHDIERIDAVAARNLKQVEQIDALIGKIHQECLTLAKQRDVSDQQIEESRVKCSKMQKEIELIGKQIGLTENDIKYYCWNHAWRSKVNVFGLGYEKSMTPDEADNYSPFIDGASDVESGAKVAPFRQGANVWELFARQWWNSAH